MAKAKKTELEENTQKPITRKTRTKKTETVPVDSNVKEVNEILEGQETSTPEEQTKPIGSLFDTINYHNVADLDRFVQNLTGDQSLYCVVQAAKAAHKRGVFSIEESEIVSRAIRVLTTPPEDKEPSVTEPEIHKS